MKDRTSAVVGPGDYSLAKDLVRFGVTHGFAYIRYTTMIPAFVMYSIVLIIAVMMFSPEIGAAAFILVLHFFGGSEVQLIDGKIVGNPLAAFVRAFAWASLAGFAIGTIATAIRGPRPRIAYRARLRQLLVLSAVVYALMLGALFLSGTSFQGSALGWVVMLLLYSVAALLTGVWALTVGRVLDRVLGWIYPDPGAAEQVRH
jgi:hypothetical protein